MRNAYSPHRTQRTQRTTRNEQLVCQAPFGSPRSPVGSAFLRVLRGECLWLFGLAFFVALPAQAALKIFATVPEWGALSQEIGGDKVEVFTASTGQQDPHHIQARPSLIARARSADLVVATGAELEIGWLPLVQRESGNARIQVGQPGYFEAAHHVRLLEIPTRLDRSEGDVHPGGNPHIQTDPRNFLPIGEALTERMAELDPADAASYRANWLAFSQRWRAAIAGWEKKAAPLRGVAVAVQHKAFPYLEDWLGLKEVATLEPKPGVEPSLAYLGQLLAQVAAKPPRLVIRSAYQAPQASEWFGREAKVPVVVVPFTVGGDEQAKDLFALFDDTVDRLLAAVK